MTQSDRQLVIDEFDASIWPAGSPTLPDAWLGIYQVLLYYEDELGLLHINDKSVLRKSRWRLSALRAEQHLAARLGITSNELPNRVDRMMRLPRWQGQQRHNPLGHGLRTLSAEILDRFGPQGLQYHQEPFADDWFPGIQLPGRSRRARIDVLITEAGKPKDILSCKWSIRHDRISDPTNECTQYKAAAQQQQAPLRFHVLTNEFDLPRLEKVIDQYCVDGLVHVSSEMLKAVHGGQNLAIQSHPKYSSLQDYIEALGVYGG